MAVRFDSDEAIGFCENCPGELPPDCNAVKRQIRRKCGVDDNRAFRRGRQQIHDRLTRPGGKRRNRGGMQVRNKTWKDDHCGALLFNPNADPRLLQQRMEELTEGAQDMKEDLLDVLEGIAPDIAADMAVTYGQRALARQAAAALCGPGAAVCTGALAVYNIASGLWTAWSAWDQISSVTDMVEGQLQRLNDIQGHAQEVIDAMDNPEELQRLREEMLDEMAQAVQENDCIQARRCFLVPYRNKGQQIPRYNQQATNGRAGLFDDPSPFSLADSRGCCPGQTGHHLIPESWLNDGSGGSRCSNYNHRAAPTACLEGYDGRYGSHGDAHQQLNNEIERRQAAGEELTMDQAIDLAVDGYTRPGSPGSNCARHKECLKEQLKQYYEDAGCADIVPGMQPGLPGSSDGDAAPSQGGAFS